LQLDFRRQFHALSTAFCQTFGKRGFDELEKRAPVNAAQAKRDLLDL